MRTIAIALCLVLAAPAIATERREPESCLAHNPGAPTCKFAITSDSSSGVVTGAVGSGSWKVIVKRGKQKTVLKPGGIEPEPLSFDYNAGDKVTAKALAPGSWVLAGHD